MVWSRAVVRRTTLLGAAAVTVIAVGSAMAAVTPESTRTTGGVDAGPGRWTATYMASGYTYHAGGAVRLAHRFDVIAALPGTFSHYTAAMRQENPDLTLLAYTNGMLTSPRIAQRLPESWFAHGLDGARIRSRGFGNYLMNPASPEWRHYAVTQCATKVRWSHYDGCFVDMLTMGVFAPGYLSALPKRPDEDRLWTQGEWSSALASLAEDFNRLGVPVVANTVTNQWRYWMGAGSTRPISLALRASLFEDFLRGAGDAPEAWPSEDEWQKTVRVIADLSANDRDAYVLTKLWQPATQEQRDQWQRFSMASFFMGAGPGSRYAFTVERSKKGANQRLNTYTLPELGRPLGAMGQVGGLYVRNFAGGMVVVNPTDQVQSLAIPDGYTSLWGTTVGNILTLGPHDGQVFQAS